MYKCLDVDSKSRISMEELADHPWIINKNFVPEKKIEKIKIEVIK